MRRRVGLEIASDHAFAVLLEGAEQVWSAEVPMPAEHHDFRITKLVDATSPAVTGASDFFSPPEMSNSMVRSEP